MSAISRWRRDLTTSRQLVLLGAGHAHLHVLHSLAQSRPADLKITVIAPHPRLLYSGMAPGFIPGHYALGRCMIERRELLAGWGAVHIPDSAVANRCQCENRHAGNGKSVSYDWLSLNTGLVMDREKIEAQMPGARQHASFVRPIEASAQLWPWLLEMARQQSVHLAVVGAGAAGLELAVAAAHALSGPLSAPGCRLPGDAGDW